jgi:signal transduction histidine kinase/CHASE3 domain sensor protein
VSAVERPRAAAPAPAARLGGGLSGRMLLASGLLMLILGAAFAVLLIAVDDLRAAARDAQASEEVLVTASELERLVVDLETGVRGFVLTGEDQFLEPWDTARRSLPAHAAALERQSAGDPEQERAARQLALAASAYVEQYAAPLVERVRRGDPAARSLAATLEGKRRVDAMRSGFGGFIATERRQAQAQQGRSDEAARRAVAAAVGGLTVSLLLVLVFASYLSRAIVQPVRRAAQMAVGLAGGNLSTRMPATGVAEIGQLERAFNDMAGSLERNRDDLAALATEQAALRRVATLVARGVSPDELFARVAEEAGTLLGADVTMMVRFGSGGRAELVAAAGETADLAPVGATWDLTGPWATTQVWQTGRSARFDGYEQFFDHPVGPVGRAGVRSSVASPIVVEGRRWGAMVVLSRAEPLPPGTEGRIADFTELVAVAVANAEARAQLRRIVEEQSALRRVATLVARAGAPSLVFEAVTREVGLLCEADLARMERYEPDGTVTGVATWGRVPVELAVGTRFDLDGVSIARGVKETGGPVRVDTFDADDSGAIATEARALGIRASVGCPIVVGGRLWGVIAASTKREEPFPPDTEAQIAEFTELVATAVENAESRAELAASRARVVAAADETRRRLERDLHDGAQQRLVSLALRLRATAATIPPDLRAVHQELAGVGAELDELLGDLRELSRGIHPAILSEGGLGPALRTLARRSSVPVQLQVGMEGRLPERVEVTAYYVVSEALTNAAKHANASAVQVDLDRDDGLVRLAIRDDGVGGADPARGSGLIGLKDRVEGTGGTLRVDSRPGEGTSLLVELPVDAGASPDAG